MFLEEYIVAIGYSYKLSDRASEFMLSLADQIQIGRNLTTRQGHAAIAHLRRISAYRDFNHKFPKLNKQDLNAAIAEKRWKDELRVSVEKRREARYLGDNLVALSFPAIPEMKLASKSLQAIWRDNLYIVTVSKSKLEPLVQFLGAYSFDISQELEEYLALCMNSDKQISHIISVSDGAAINVCDDNLFGDFILHMCKGQRI